MKKIYKLLGFFCMIALGFGVFCNGANASEEENKVDIMFLHDTHSHLNPFATVEDGESQIMGGFSRIKTLINEQKEKNPDTFLLDGGDFSMGTLIQVIFEEEASEIRMLGELGFDITTLGNHEFDYKAKGLSNMMNHAVDSGDALPSMVVCNVDWEKMKQAGLTEDQQMLLSAFENYGVEDYAVVEKNGIRMAVIGVFGMDALACVPNSPLEFLDPVTAVQETVKVIQANEAVDMIVCVSHSGTWDDEEKSEDEILAKNVPELDLIISGHTHTKLDEPIIHGDTYIVSAGEYGKYLGQLSMTQNAEGRWTMESYELVTVGEDIKADESTQAKIDGFESMIDSVYLEQFGFTKDQVLCNNTIPFAESSDTANLHTEINLGSFMADAYMDSVEKVLGEDTVDVAVVPSGVIRDTYALGELTTENAYNSFSLGIGEDGIPGYPLIGVYLTGAELKTAAEIDASISDFMTTARLYTDGLYWNYNPNRMLLNKVTDVYIDDDGVREELVDDKLYYVVTDFYTSQMLGGVTDLSYGLLSIVPKFEDGTPIENYEDAVIYDGDQELKAWVAIARYMASMEDVDGDGIGDVPEKYGTVEGRKIVEDSKNIGELLKNPNKFFFIITALIVVVIILFVGVIMLIRRIFKRKKSKTE